MYEVLSGMAFLTLVAVLVRTVIATVQPQRTCLICGEPVRTKGILDWLEPPIHKPAAFPECRP